MTKYEESNGNAYARLQLTLRATVSDEPSSSADNISYPEQTATILEKDAGPVSRVCKSKVTSVQHKATDDI